MHPKFLAVLLLPFALSPIAVLAQKAKVKAYTDPEVAAEHAGFALQGEYVKDGAALQVIALKDGQFHVSGYAGGLPGAGWDGSEISRLSVDAAGLKAAVAGYERTVRESPTLGKAAPEGAVVLFGEGGEPNDFGGKVEEGLLVQGCKSETLLKDFQLHLEFRLPYKPDATPGSQDRGNSGLYIFNNFEVQVIDSFGLDFDPTRWPEGKTPSDPKQWCGCLYKFKLADVNACLPPLSWQTYDIDFTAPRFDGEGKKTKAGRITVRQNGIVIHDDVELPAGTGAGAKRPKLAEGPLHLQEHGNPVRFRNIWAVRK